MDARQTVNEDNPLIQDHPETLEETTPRHWPTLIAKGALGLAGAGAGILYFGPSQTCAITKDCGLWLTDLTSETTSIVIFTAGGLDFSAGAVYMGAQSVDATKNYINAQSSYASKIGKGGLIILVTLSQNVPLLLASLSTTPVLWQTILTVGGNLPGSLYGIINLTQTEIPYLMSKAAVFASNLHHRIADSCKLNGLIDKQEWQMISHYRKQHEHFLNEINARWDYVVANASKLKPDLENDDALTFLFQHDDVRSEPSLFAQGVHYFGSFTGFLLALNLAAGGVKNTFNMIGNYIPTLPLQLLSTGLLSIAQVYGHIKLTMDGMTALLDPIVDILRGKPVNSSIFQLRPNTTLLIGGISIALSALSYAVIAVLFINEFGPDNNQTDTNSTQLDEVRRGFLFSAMAGVDIYHLASLIHLYRLFYAALTPDKKEQFILSLEHEVQQLNQMTETQFIDFVKTNSAETNQMLGLDVFQEYPDVVVSDLVVHSTDDDTITLTSSPADKIEEESIEKENTTSFFGNWFSWFKFSNTESKPTDENQLIQSHEQIHQGNENDTKPILSIM